MPHPWVSRLIVKSHGLSSLPRIFAGVLSTVTGGSVFFHPRFDAARDRFRVNDEIQRVLVRDIAYNVAVRLRCSNGESCAV